MDEATDKVNTTLDELATRCLMDEATGKVNTTLDELATKKEKLQKTLKELSAKGEIVYMSGEEIDMIRYFRKFKNTIKRADVFRWQTFPVEHKSGEQDK